MYVKMYNENPNPRHVRAIVDILKSGGVIIYPTDTVYGLGCDIYNSQAIEKVARLKGLRPDKAQFSFIVSDLSDLSNYTRFVKNDIFKLMKSLLPGPYTFILHASSNVPKIMKTKKKTVGIRIPDNNIILDIVRELGNPILTTSIHDSDDIIDYTTDPEIINDNFKTKVDAVIDGGFGGNVPSTVIDCTEDQPLILREGAGQIQDLTY